MSQSVVSTASVLRCAEHVLAGGVAIVPTESFYALAVCPQLPAAVSALVACKGGRAADKALPLVAADLAMAQQLCLFNATAAALAEQFWPGPLTLALPARKVWPCHVQSPQGTLGVRVSDHAFLQALSAAVAGPLTVTSANLVGAPPVTALSQVRLACAQDVMRIDGGTLPGGLPSTVVVCGEPPNWQVVRAGAVPPAAIAAAMAARGW